MRRIYWLAGLFVLALLALGSGPSQAQGDPGAAAPQAVSVTGRGVTYQGELKSGGVPVNATCDFVFRLWDAPTSGNQVNFSAQTAPNVTVADGLFTVVINPNGEFGFAAFNGGPRYLEVNVRCPAGSGSYTQLAPRQPIAAAPYALGLAPGAIISDSVGYTRLGDDGMAVSPAGVFVSSPERAVVGINAPALTNNFLPRAGVAGLSEYADGYGGYFQNSAGAALYVSGDALQPLSGDGLLKAAVYATCGNAGSSIIRSFNSASTSTFSISNGTLPGFCTIDFDFAVSDRFIQVTAVSGTGGARGGSVNFVYGAGGDLVEFIRFNTADGLGENGGLYILVY